MALDLVAELEGLVAQLAQAGVDYAVCGGLAVAIHGHPRATMDIDLLIPPNQLAEAMRVARNLEFDVPARKMVFGARSATPREVQRISKLDNETGVLLSLDLIIVGAGLEAVWQDRVRVSWHQRDVWLVSRSGLVAMKRLAGRPQDMADIAALEGRGSDADED
jgi:hypothetical protein